MEIAPLIPDPSSATVQRDRKRVAYAALGAMALVAGIWVCWLGAWTMGWNLDDLGIRPRDPHGLIGILSAPFVHASFAHLMSNTLPLGLLAGLALYAYPRATRYALPFIWIASGIGVWLWARESVHVGISVIHGHARATECRGRGGLAHADAAGESDDLHQHSSCTNAPVCESCGQLREGTSW